MFPASNGGLGAGHSPRENMELMLFLDINKAQLIVHMISGFGGIKEI